MLWQPEGPIARFTVMDVTSAFGNYRTVAVLETDYFSRFLNKSFLGPRGIVGGGGRDSVNRTSDE